MRGEMPRNIWKQRIERYIAVCERRQLSWTTIETYRRICRRAGRALKAKGINKDPKRIREYEMEIILKEFKHDMNAINQLRTFLNFLGNTIITDMHIKIKKGRTKVDWLTINQAEIVWTTAETPIEKLMIHSELNMGLRRCEIVRLRLQDLKPNHWDVFGKGMKWRQVPKHPYTDSVLTDYIDHRDLIISREKKKRPDLKESNYLVIWGRDGRVGNYKRPEALDIHIRNLSKRCGFHFSNHVLRRTFGRELYNAGVKLKTISDLMGHESVEVTMKYIGIQMNEMTNAMKKYYQHQKSFRETPIQQVTD